MTYQYEKPQAIVMTGSHEGVYMASGAGAGSGANWNIHVVSDQSWNGTDHVFTAECTLNSGDTCSISNLTITAAFNYELTGVRVVQNEFSCFPSGNTVTLTMNKDLQCGPGYKIYAQFYAHTADQATTEGLCCTSASAVSI